MFDEIYERLYEANEMLAESNLDNHHKKVLDKDVILPFIETYNKKFFNVYREIEMLENVLQNCKNQTSYETYRSVENLRHNVEQFYAMFLNKSFDNVINAICQNLSQLTNRFVLVKFNDMLKDMGLYEQLSKKYDLHPQIEETQRFASIKDW